MNELVFKECVRNGYSTQNGSRVWDIASYPLLYSSPELVAGYLNLRSVPRYKDIILNRELTLLQRHSKHLFTQIKQPFNFIELWCGDGSKAAAFLQSSRASQPFRYIPTHISRRLLDLASTKVRSIRHKHHKETKPFVSSFKDFGKIGGMVRNSKFQRNVVYVHGSTLASFDINEFLYELSNDMFSGDVLVIGNGIRKGKRFVNLNTYKHPAFNEWLMPLMKGLGFDESEVRYDVRFANGRLEALYHIGVDKTISYGGKRVSFKKDDKVVAAVQYKFYQRELEKFCNMYFSDVRFFKDKDNEFALIFCVK